QDCDLLRDFEAAQAGTNRPLNGVLVFEANTVDITRSLLPGSDILRRIKSHNAERYHLISAVAPENDLLSHGLPDLIIDFRRFYTMPAEEIYRQCASTEEGAAKRRCRLDTPFREHLQSRAAFYLQRVALPD